MENENSPMGKINKKLKKLDDKVDEILSYVKPQEPEPPEPTVQEQLNNALAQVEALKQALIDKVAQIQALQNQNNP